MTLVLQTRCRKDGGVPRLKKAEDLLQEAVDTEIQGGPNERHVKLNLAEVKRFLLPECACQEGCESCIEKLASAMGLLEELLETSADDLDALYLRANFLVYATDYAEAIKDLLHLERCLLQQDSMEGMPDQNVLVAHEGVLILLGDAYAHTGNYREAMTSFQRCLDKCSLAIRQLVKDRIKWVAQLRGDVDETKLASRSVEDRRHDSATPSFVPERGSQVTIEGLTTDAGRLLNGKIGVVERKAAGGRLGIRVAGELVSIKHENLRIWEDHAGKGSSVSVSYGWDSDPRKCDLLAKSIMASFVTSENDLDPSKNESEMLNVGVSESLESAFEAATDASDFARMRQEPWAERVVVKFNRHYPQVDRKLLSSPVAERAKACGCNLMPPWAQGAKILAPNITSLAGVEGAIPAAELRPNCVLFENVSDMRETFAYLKEQGLPYNMVRPKKDGIRFEPELLPGFESSSSGGSHHAEASDGDQEAWVEYNTFMELRAEHRANVEAKYDTKSSHSF